MSTQESKKRPASKGGKGAKASARSSKTDHVLNLLGGGHSAPPPEEPAVQTGQAAPPEHTTPATHAAPAPQADQTAPAAQVPAEEGAPATPAAQPQTPPPASPVLTAPATPSLPILEVARNNNQRLSDTICSALEQALAEEEGTATQAPTAPAEEPEATPIPEPVPQEAAPEPTPEPPPQEPAPTPAPEPVLQEPEPEPAPVPQEPEPVSQEPVPEPEPEPEAPPAPPAEPEGSSAPKVSNSVEPKPAPAADQEDSLILPGNALYLNVLELLVDEAMERYGKATGLCPCARCRADAKALALSRLPAKYVVLPAPAMPPMISLYREEFSSDVLAQVLFACSTVKEHPRHPQG